MPSISGVVAVSLTVSDPERSGAWYADLLDMREQRRYVKPDGHVGEVCLVEPATGLQLCFVDHAENAETSFSEFRTGLDHLELLVPHRGDLDVWADRLDRLHIHHSGVKQPSYTANAMITFRDPDNIQLEFFWRAPASGT